MGNEVLKVGCIVIFIVIIKFYFWWDGGVMIFLFCCVDIVEVFFDYLVFDFEVGVKKCVFKEMINLFWEFFVLGGKIIGELYFYIYWIWKEDGCVYELKYGFSVFFSDDDIKDLIVWMVYDVYVLCIDGDGNVDMKNVKDRKFLKEIWVWWKLILINIKILLKELYMVDDVFVYKFCIDIDLWGVFYGMLDDVMCCRLFLFISIFFVE